MSRVVLYTNSSDPLYYNKSLTQLADTECDFKSPIDIERPSIVIRGKYDTCNYVYIPHFNRYYFVERCIGLSDNLIQLNCVSDVLSSVDLSNLSATVERQEFKRNTQIIDNELICQANTNFICKQVGSAVNDGYNIFITTCGG